MDRARFNIKTNMAVVYMMTGQLQLTIKEKIDTDNNPVSSAASQAGDADFSRAPGLTSGLQGSVNVHPWCSIVGATVTVHQFFCFFHILKYTYMLNIMTE